MYKTAYAQEAGESLKTLRDGERQVFEQSIALLEKAEAEGAGTMAATEAIVFVRRLWTLLLEDLSNEENALPAETRASFISIGLWMLKESDEIRLGKSNNFKALIDVTSSIRDGLK